MIQPSLIHGGWLELKDGDESARTIFDRHYSRRVYADGRKPKQFIGPGVKHPLMLADGRALFAWRKFISDDDQAGVNCAIFRNEQDDAKCSQLIREAVAIARERWWPLERFYTYVDPAKAKPVMVRGVPCFGFCFLKAGWHYVGVTKSGKLIWALESPPAADASDPHVTDTGKLPTRDSQALSDVRDVRPTSECIGITSSKRGARVDLLTGSTSGPPTRAQTDQRSIASEPSTTRYQQTQRRNSTGTFTSKSSARNCSGN